MHLGALTLKSTHLRPVGATCTAEELAVWRPVCCVGTLYRPGGAPWWHVERKNTHWQAPLQWGGLGSQTDCCLLPICETGPGLGVASGRIWKCWLRLWLISHQVLFAFLLDYFFLSPGSRYTYCHLIVGFPQQDDLFIFSLVTIYCESTRRWLLGQPRSSFQELAVRWRRQRTHCPAVRWGQP